MRFAITYSLDSIICPLYDWTLADFIHPLDSVHYFSISSLNNWDRH